MNVGGQFWGRWVGEVWRRVEWAPGPTTRAIETESHVPKVLQDIVIE